MKYTKLIITACALALVLIGAGIAYNILVKNNTEKSDSTSSVSADTTSAAASSGSSAGSSSVTSPEAAQGIEIGDMAYDFTLPDKDGEQVSLSDFRGKIVVINFWASWCGYCVKEMPDFQTLQDELTAQGAEADTVILSIDWADGKYETQASGQEFLDKNGYTFPVVFDSGDVASQYQLYGIPQTIIVNKEGIISEKFLGATTKDKLDAAIEEAGS